MSLSGFLMPFAIIIAAYWWVVLPRLRKLAWWEGLVARVWAIAGNSKTIAVAYAVELVGVMERCSTGRNWWARRMQAGSW
jgi:hypothetical protein